MRNESPDLRRLLFGMDATKQRNTRQSGQEIDLHRQIEWPENRTTVSLFLNDSLYSARLTSFVAFSRQSLDGNGAPQRSIGAWEIPFDFSLIIVTFSSQLPFGDFP